MQAAASSLCQAYSAVDLLELAMIFGVLVQEVQYHQAVASKLAPETGITLCSQVPPPSSWV